MQLDPLRALKASSIEDLADQVGLLKYSEDPHIYFLCKDGRIVYIGRSCRLKARLAEHTDSDKEYTDVYYTQVDRSHVDGVERALIRLFRPEYNVVHNTCDLTAEDLDPLAAINMISRALVAEDGVYHARSGNGFIDWAVAWIDYKARRIVAGLETSRTDLVRFYMYFTEPEDSALRKHLRPYVLV